MRRHGHYYIVDEKDIIGYNKKGEKILLKNQSAYYKAVECNRTSDDEMYNILGKCADMNGGSLALTGAGGIVLGAAVTAIAVTVKKKSDNNNNVTA